MRRVCRVALRHAVHVPCARYMSTGRGGRGGVHFGIFGIRPVSMTYLTHIRVTITSESSEPHITSE